MEAIKQEAVILTRLSHANIIKSYGICYDPVSLVMELCEGSTYSLETA